MNFVKIHELKLTIKSYIPETIWISLIKLYNFIGLRKLYAFYLINRAPKRHRRALELVRKKENVKVAFFLNHESVWKYEVLYDLMVKHPRFEPKIFVCPVVNFGTENMLFEMDKAFEAFKRKGYNVVKTFNSETGEYLDIKKNFSPDIVFFLQNHMRVYKITDII